MRRVHFRRLCLVSGPHTGISLTTIICFSYGHLSCSTINKRKLGFCFSFRISLPNVLFSCFCFLETLRKLDNKKSSLPHRKELFRTWHSNISLFRILLNVGFLKHCLLRLFIFLFWILYLYWILKLFIFYLKLHLLSNTMYQISFQHLVIELCIFQCVGVTHVDILW